MKRLMLFAALSIAATKMNAKDGIKSGDGTNTNATKADSSKSASQMENSKITIAPEIGMYYSATDYKSLTGNALTKKAKYCPRIGFNISKDIGEKTFIQAGLFYFQSGSKLSETYYNFGLSSGYNSNITINNIQLPVNLGYNFSLGKGRLFVTAGPYVGYEFAGKNTKDVFTNSVPMGTQKSDLIFGSGVTSNMKRFDYGANFSVGYELPLGLYIRGQYTLGIRQLSNNTTTSIRQEGISASLGYTFHLKKKKEEQ